MSKHSTTSLIDSECHRRCEKSPKDPRPSKGVLQYDEEPFRLKLAKALFPRNIMTGAPGASSNPIAVQAWSMDAQRCHHARN